MMQSSEIVGRRMWAVAELRNREEVIFEIRVFCH
jgi:hypothetical protein